MEKELCSICGDMSYWVEAGECNACKSKREVAANPPVVAPSVAGDFPRNPFHKMKGGVPHTLGSSVGTGALHKDERDTWDVWAAPTTPQETAPPTSCSCGCEDDPTRCERINGKAPDVIA